MTRPTSAALVVTCPNGHTHWALAKQCPLCAKPEKNPFQGPQPADLPFYVSKVEPGKGGRESLLQEACGQWLTLQDIEWLHLSVKAREHKGWPDLTYCCQGIPVAIELKSASGELSEDQIDCLSRMHRNGWRVAVCRTLAEVQRFHWEAVGDSR